MILFTMNENLSTWRVTVYQENKLLKKNKE